MTDAEKPPQTRSGDIDVFSPEEVWALVRAADSEQDGAIFLTAAFTGLRLGELIALHWRDVDFTGSLLRVRASYAGGALTTPKSGKVRSVPLAPEVAKALAKLGQREHFTGDDELVFVGEAGSYLDGSVLRRRYKRALTKAKLLPLRFHDLRHTFGTRMIAKADIRRVQEWMGHADIQTTMRYLHYAPREEDARLVAGRSRSRWLNQASAGKHARQIATTTLVPTPRGCLLVARDLARVGEMPGSRAALYRPDLALVSPDGRVLAIEVELSVKAVRRLAAICRGWARARHVGHENPRC